MRELFEELNPLPRLLMGPGPITADPRVLRAMSAQLLGQFDPQFRTYMAETMELYRQVFETRNRWTMLVDSTARGGIESVMVSLIEPGDIRTEFNERTEWGESSRSPYGERLERAEQVIRESLPKAPEPKIVARTIERALTSRRPRVRYTVGPDSFLVPLGRRLLPDRWALRLIRNHFRV